VAKAEHLKALVQTVALAGVALLEARLEEQGVLVTLQLPLHHKVITAVQELLVVVLLLVAVEAVQEVLVQREVLPPQKVGMVVLEPHLVSLAHL
jgi:hypothetical protein